MRFFPTLNTSTITEQVAAHLREDLSRGRWTGLMPGRDRLVAELGVNGRTIEKALDAGEICFLSGAENTLPI